VADSACFAEAVAVDCSFVAGAEAETETEAVDNDCFRESHYDFDTVAGTDSYIADLGDLADLPELVDSEAKLQLETRF
jgi:hypothetical protein